MRVAIIGIGNVMMADDGVGPAVIAELEKRRLPKGVILVDAGCASLELLYELERHDAAVLVDCVDFGGRPGEVRTIAPKDIRAERTNAQITLHRWDSLSTLKLMEVASTKRPRILIVAIQPERVEMAQELTAVVRRSVPPAADAAVAAIAGLARHGLHLRRCAKTVPSGPRREISRGICP